MVDSGTESKLERAYELKAAEQFSEAIELLTELIEKELTPEMLRLRAECYIASGQQSLGVDDFRRMAKLVMANLAGASNSDDALHGLISQVGSVKKVSAIDHFIICPKEKVQKLISQLEKLGFDVDEPNFYNDEFDEDDEDFERYAGMAGVQFHETSKPEDMKKRTKELEKLASRFGGRYDGWGTRIS